MLNMINLQTKILFNIINYQYTNNLQSIIIITTNNYYTALPLYYNTSNLTILYHNIQYKIIYNYTIKTITINNYYTYNNELNINNNTPYPLDHVIKQ